MALEYEEIDLGQVDGINGTNGKEVELQLTATHIQWRYKGASTWINLVSLSTITGPQGLQGVAGKKLMIQVSGGYIQYKYDSDTTWVNLIALSSITGATGPVGPALSFKVGTVTTLPAGSTATVTATVANNLITLSLGIPQGIAGVAGKDGNAKIANNLTTTDVTYALSAPQGKMLNELKADKLDVVQIGQMVLSAMKTIPNGWLECNGQAISRTTYATLFTAIGTTFGAGNGTTTFLVPNKKVPLDYTLTGTVVQLESAQTGLKWLIKAKEV